MAQNKKVKTLKVLETTSMWCAIASLLVFFGNLIAFVAILAIGGNSTRFDWNGVITQLTLITEMISLICILAWIVMAIIEMVMIGRNKELRKYHYGSFALWIIAMVISLGFLFLSLLIFIMYASDATIYVTFILYLAATAGSIMYIASVSRSLRRIRYAE